MRFSKALLIEHTIKRQSNIVNRTEKQLKATVSFKTLSFHWLIRYLTMLSDFKELVKSIVFIQALTKYVNVIWQLFGESSRSRLDWFCKCNEPIILDMNKWALHTKCLVVLCDESSCEKTNDKRWKQTKQNKQINKQINGLATMDRPPPRGVLPYIKYIGMCRPKG